MGQTKSILDLGLQFDLNYIPKTFFDFLARLGRYRAVKNLSTVRQTVRQDENNTSYTRVDGNDWNWVTVICNLTRCRTEP